MNYIVLAGAESMLHYRTLGLRYGVHVVLEGPGAHSAPEFDYLYCHRAVFVLHAYIMYTSLSDEKNKGF